jgi:hypothetical protein
VHRKAERKRRLRGWVTADTDELSCWKRSQTDGTDGTDGTDRSAGLGLPYVPRPFIYPRSWSLSGLQSQSIVAVTDRGPGLPNCCGIAPINLDSTDARMGRRGLAGSLRGRRVADDAHARWRVRRGQSAVRRGARSNRCSAKLYRDTSNDARLDVDEYETLAIQYSGPGALQDHPGRLSGRGLLQPGEAFYTEKQDQKQERNRNRRTD